VDVTFSQGRSILSAPISPAARVVLRHCESLQVGRRGPLVMPLLSLKHFCGREVLFACSNRSSWLSVSGLLSDIPAQPN
jgi:hypothetical protein